jgi:hypothetical protein
MTDPQNRNSVSSDPVNEPLVSIKKDLAEIKRIIENQQLKNTHAEDSRHYKDEVRIRREELGQAILAVLLFCFCGLAGVWLSIEEPPRTSVVGLVVIVTASLAAIKILLQWMSGQD